MLEEKGVIINDLYNIIVKDIDRYIRSDDNIHLTDEGSEVCAKQIVDIIKKTAETLPDSEQKINCEEGEKFTAVRYRSR